MKRSVLLMLLCALGLVAAPLAYADGEGCDHPEIPVDAKDQAFYTNSFKAVRVAVPLPPAGWQYADASKHELMPDYKDYVPSAACYVGGYYVGLDVDYTRPTTKAEIDKMTAAMHTQADPAKQKQLMALMAQQQALVVQTMTAAQKQDTKTMDSLSKQSDALNKQINALQADMNSGSQGAMAEASFDHKAKVRISVNDASGDLSCYGSPKPLQVAGAIAYQCENPTTYSSPGNPLDSARGHIVIFYGKGAKVETDEWDRQDAQGQEHKDSSVVIRYVPDNNLKRTVQVVVDIEGDNLDRALSLFKGMNLKPLAALIK